MESMPFTVSHAAAAIPFQRTRLVPSALVIGCMVPDFEYFLRFGPHGGFGHTVPGVFLLDVPAAWIALWLFHSYAKMPLYTWLPEGVQQRIQPGSPALPVRNLAQCALVLLSILIGIATHLLWDSFTHPGFWPYRHWPFLHQTVQLPGFGHLEYLRAIQHASTILGAAVLLLWFLHWLRRTPPTQPEATPPARENPRTALIVICIMALLAAFFRGFLLPGWKHGHLFAPGKFLFESAIITAITVFWMGVVLYGVLRGRARNEIEDA